MTDDNSVSSDIPDEGGPKFRADKPNMCSDFRKTEQGRRLAAVLADTRVQTVLGLALVTTLFLPDFWVIGNPGNDMDNILNTGLILAFVIFFVEIVVTSLVQANYYNSAFYWMDVIGTLSIAIDLSWTAKALLALPGGADPGTLRAARVAKLGVRAGRMARIAKFFKFLSFGSKSGSDDEDDSAARVSAKLGTVLSQRVALLIMTIVVINPFLTSDIKDYSGSGFLMSFDAVAKADAFSSDQWNTAVAEFNTFYRAQRLQKEVTTAEPVWLKVHDISEVNCPTAPENEHYDVEWQPAQGGGGGEGYCRFTFDRGEGARNLIIRDANKHWVTGADRGKYPGGESCSAGSPEFSFACDHLSSVDALFDNTPLAVEEAWLSSALICVVIVLLLVFSATFAMAVDNLVVKPIARIMFDLQESAQVVLSSVKMVAGDRDDDDENGITEAEVLELMVKKLARIVHKSTGDMMKEMLEEDGGMTDRDTTAWLSDYSSVDLGGPGDESSSGWRTNAPLLCTPVMDKSLPVDEALLNSYSFDVFAVEEPDKLVPCVRFMFERFNLSAEFSVAPEVFEKWMVKVKNGYNDVPYHGWWHGVDVFHKVVLLLQETAASEFMSKLEFFSLLVAALAHDVGHPGVNNGFLVKTKHELALLHNDASPLENMHASRLYETFQNPTTNILANLSEAQWHACRRQMLSCILNTDMAHHFSNLQRLEMFEEVNGPFIHDFLERRLSARASVDDNQVSVPDCLKDPNNRLHLQEVILHAGDLANPVMPLNIYTKWVERVTQEFFAQGDQEKDMGLPASPMCDRDTANIPNMQLGFIDFIIAPFFSTLFKLFPEAFQPLALNIQDNYEHFVKLRTAEAPEEAEKLKDNTKKLKLKLRTNRLGSMDLRDTHAPSPEENSPAATQPATSVNRRGSI